MKSTPVIHLLSMPAEFDAQYEVWCGAVEVHDSGVLLTCDAALVTCPECKSRKPGAMRMAKQRREKRRDKRRQW